MANGIPIHEIRREFDEGLYVEREAELAMLKNGCKVPGVF
jgi:hypothetical protein